MITITPDFFIVRTTGGSRYIRRIVKSLQEIREQLALGEFEFSRHAFHRSVERNISEREIREAGSGAEIVETYPGDKYSPSMLLLGSTASGRPLHPQVSCAETDKVRIITLYVPDPSAWDDYRRRR